MLLDSLAINEMACLCFFFNGSSRRQLWIISAANTFFVFIGETRNASLALINVQIGYEEVLAGSFCKLACAANYKEDVVSPGV